MNISSAAGADTVLVAFWLFGVFIAIAIVIIQLVFFVKLWNMTNDVARIKDLLETQFERDARAGRYLPERGDK